MGIFEQFPYSNFHNANLDNVLNNSNQALRDAANAVHIAGEAKDIAEGLTDDVTTALQEAEAASTAAASAEATAAQAQAEAEAVSGLAQDAYNLASAADSAAANALSVANTANSNASAAVTTANAASTAASNAVATANTANTNASAALDAVNNIPDASTTERGLVSTGAQTFAGAKSFLERPTMSGSIRYPGFIFASVNGSQIGALVGLEYIDTGSATFGQMGDACWSVEVHGNDGNGGISPYRERYLLPFVTVGRANNANYRIWTTKVIPEPPAAAGTYTLKATRTSSGVTYSWV